MKTARLVAPLSVLALCAAASSAHAAPLFYGADSSTRQVDIYADGGLNNGVFRYDDSQSMFRSTVSILPGDADETGFGPFNRGTTFAEGQINPLGHNLTAPPLLRAAARLSGNASDLPFEGDLPVGAVGEAQVGALDVFQYLGAVPTTLTLTYTLEAVVSGGSFLGSPTYAVARAVVLNDQLRFFNTSIDTLAFESGATLLSHNGVSADQAVVVSESGGAIAQRTMVLPFDVAPGQVFYVAAKMVATASGGTNFADASNTLFGSFDHPELIASLSLPTPGAAALVGLAGLVAARRRR